MIYSLLLAEVFMQLEGAWQWKVNYDLPHGSETSKLGSNLSGSNTEVIEVTLFFWTETNTPDPTTKSDVIFTE